MNVQSCSYDDDREIAARYVANRLNGSEAETYELHLLSCDECRTAVNEAAAIRAAFRLRRRRRRLAMLVPAGAAAAAAIAWVLLLPSQLERLGRVNSAPALTVMAVRANPDSAALHGERGIRAYEARNFKEAVQWFRLARQAQPEPAVAFFLGASHLMARDPDSAIVALREVTAGDSPYRREAHYYTAKAWLQLGQRDSAIVQLRAIDARALLDSIDRVR